MMRLGVSNLILHILGLTFWTIFIGLPLLVWKSLKLVFRLFRILRHSPKLFSQTIRCPNGHENPAVSFWTCSCGVTFSGWAWAPCPGCGKSADFVDGCQVCGVSLLNPLR